MIEIWYVEDYLSKEVLENRYFSSHEEATCWRNKLEYGLVKRLEVGRKSDPTAYDPVARWYELQRQRDTE